MSVLGGHGAPWGGGPCTPRCAGGFWCSRGWRSLHPQVWYVTVPWAGAEPGPGAAPQDMAEPREDAGSEGLAASPSPGNVEDMYELLEKLGR